MLVGVGPPEAEALRATLAEAGLPLREALADALILVAAADGEVVTTEREQLLALLGALGCSATVEKLEAMAALFRRPDVQEIS